MNADPTAPDPRAGIVQQLLLAALLGLALLVLVLLLRELRPLVGGERAPARVAAWTGEQTMALEVHRSVLERAPGLPQPQEAGPVHEEHRLVEQPIPPYLWAGIGDPVTLAWDPAAPQRARVLDLGANGVPVAAQVALLLLLALASLGVHRLPIGRDRIRVGGCWIDTRQQALRPGTRATAEQTLREPDSQRRGLRFWVAFLTLATLAIAAGGVLAWDDAPIEVAATGVLVLVFDVLLAYTWIVARSRRVRWDDDGVADIHFFGVRRLPWAAIARFERVNVNQVEQQRYDRAPFGRNRGRMRPPSHFKWIVSEVGGSELLELPVALEESPAFQDLQRRTGGFERGPYGLAMGAAREPSGVVADEAEEDDDEVPASDRPYGAALATDPHAQALQADFRRVARWGLALVLLPFALAAALSTWQTLQFVFLAERAEGRVVEKSDDGLPQLTVAYQPLQGPELRIHSDGHAGNADIAVGDVITVFFHVDDPTRARLDQFLELWLWPMIFGVLLLTVAVPAWLITRASSRPPRR